MDRVFEDEFMEAQSRIVALCVEFAGNRADKVYAYGSIEESSISFNAFFDIDGQIKTTNNIAANSIVKKSYRYSVPIIVCSYSIRE